MAHNQRVVGHDAGRVDADVGQLILRECRDEVECVAESMCRPTDMLHHVKRAEQLRQLNRTLDGGIIHMNIEITSNNDRAGVQYSCFEDGGQIVEKQTGWWN